MRKPASGPEARVLRTYHIGAESQPFHHARPETFDQRIGMAKEIKHPRD